MALKRTHGVLGSAKNNGENRQHSEMLQTRAEISAPDNFFSSLLAQMSLHLPNRKHL
jgi:hypothetical protein